MTGPPVETIEGDNFRGNDHHDPLISRSLLRSSSYRTMPSYPGKNDLIGFLRRLPEKTVRLAL